MNNRFLRACWREPVDATPVWFMRQAGRYMPGYREVRKSHGVLDIARTPELACQVALEPVRKLGVDAAILFADIALPVQAMGFPIDIEKDVGPVSPSPIRTPEDVGRLGPFDPSLMPFIPQTIALLKERLGPIPLIGFSAAPFTLASYLIEGRPSKDFAHTKAFMWRFPQAWDDLMTRLADGMGAYLRMQADAGVDALQIFDTWVGGLSPSDFEARALPGVRHLIGQLRETRVPLILFGLNSGALLPSIATAGADVVSVDWRLPLDDAWARVGENLAIQGNLDPSVMMAPAAQVDAQVQDVVERADGRPGHIFNLGHGVLPDTPVDHARRVVDRVHALTAGGA